MLKQQMQTQARSQRQNLQSQLNANTQRVQQETAGQRYVAKFGKRCAIRRAECSRQRKSGRMLNTSQPMLQRGGGTPQPDIPLAKTISPRLKLTAPPKLKVRADLSSTVGADTIRPSATLCRPLGLIGCDATRIRRPAALSLARCSSR